MKIAKFFVELYFIHAKSFLSSMEFPKPKTRRVGVIRFFLNWRVALRASVDVLMVSFSAFLLISQLLIPLESVGIQTLALFSKR